MAGVGKAMARSVNAPHDGQNEWTRPYIRVEREAETMVRLPDRSSILVVNQPAKAYGHRG